MPIEAPALPSDRLTQRLVEERDLPDLLAIHSVDEVNRFLPYTTWKGMADAEAWYGRAVGRHEDGSAMQFVIVENESRRVVGTSLLFRFDRDNKRCDLGYALGQGWWGRGYMREAVSTLLDHAFGPMALRRIEAEVDPRNGSSHGLLLRLGFTHEGVMRQRYLTKGEVKDVNAYGLLRDEWAASRVAPLAS
jgi:[ribosomal protein S5]-alanine N-acetyltransferase